MKSSLSKLRFACIALAAGVAASYPMATVAAATAKVYEQMFKAVTEKSQGSYALGANTLTSLIPMLYERLDRVSRELVGLVQAVRRDTQLSRAAKGQGVTSPIAPTVTAVDITPGVTAPNDGDQVIGSKLMTITKARMIPIRWNGEEQLALTNGNGVGYSGILADQFEQAFRALTNEMENDMFVQAYKSASRAYGTPGTAPFGIPNDLSDFAQIAKILDDNGVPQGGRQMLIGTDAMAMLRGKQSVLFKVNEAGTADLLRNGIVGRVQGFDLRYSAAVKQITKGTGAGYTTNAAGYAIGATAITVITGTGTVNAGDVITFAGDPNKYAVTGGITGPGVLTIGGPGLRQAIPAAATAITLSNSYVPNIGFGGGDLILATRLPALPIGLDGVAGDMADDRTVVQDPVSGLAFEVSVYRQYKQIKFEVAAVWGTGSAKDEGTAILQG